MIEINGMEAMIIEEAISLTTEAITNTNNILHLDQTSIFELPETDAEEKQ